MAAPLTIPEGSADLPFTIEPVVGATRFLNLLVYGDFGVGKTRLAGSACGVPEMNDVLLINAESGELTLESDELPFDTIDQVRITDFRGVARVYDFLKTHCEARDAGDLDRLRRLEGKLKGLDPATIETPKQYRTVIIDSLSEVEAYCMNQLLGIGDQSKIDEETATAEWGEYKRNHSMMQRLVRSFRDLPLHLIMTCHRAWDQDEQKKFLYTPAMTGKLRSQVQGFVDMVGYLVIGQASEAGETPRRLYVQPTVRWAAKCRFSKFKEAFIENPTMETILNAIGMATGLAVEEVKPPQRKPAPPTAPVRKAAGTR